MFASTTHLSIRRPSPTTVLFTVSNASPRQTITSQILFYLTCLLRVLIAASTALLLVVKSQCTAKTNDIDVYLAECPSWLPKYSPILVRTATTSKWQHVAPISLVVLFLCFRRFYTEESLLVLRTLGIQTSTTSSTYLSASTTRFIPTSQIQDIFIYEAFKGFEVRYYLAAVVEGEAEVVVVFPTLLPKRDIVEQVWRGARACLFEPKG